MRIKDRSAESKARIRELAAERQRKFRENKKQCGSNAAVTRNALRNALRGVTGVTEAVTVTPELTVSHRETVTPQIQNKIENKSVEEPSPVSQRETGANGHRQLSHDDLKKWMNTLFGRQRAWSYEEDELLSRIAPIAKGDRALLSWAYTQPRDSDGWVLIEGKRASKPKQSVILLLREFSSEIDKWRSGRTNGAPEPEAPKQRIGRTNGGRCFDSCSLIRRSYARFATRRGFTMANRSKNEQRMQL